jgi:hypothetical protein
VHEAPVPIEPPITRERVARGIASAPRAASVLLDLLRVIETMPVDEALVAESLAYGLLQGSAEHARWLDMRAPVLPQARGRVLLARDGDTLLVTLDHASAGNAIDVAMRDGLREGFELAALDPDIARIELRGLGKAFCVGGDLAEFGTTRDPATAHAIRMATLPALALYLADPLDLCRERRIVSGEPADLCLLSLPWSEASERLDSADVRATWIAGSILDAVDQPPPQRHFGPHPLA